MIYPVLLISYKLLQENFREITWFSHNLEKTNDSKKLNWVFFLTYAGFILRHWNRLQTQKWHQKHKPLSVFTRCLLSIKSRNRRSLISPEEQLTASCSLFSQQKPNPSCITTGCLGYSSTESHTVSCGYESFLFKGK